MLSAFFLDFENFFAHFWRKTRVFLKQCKKDSTSSLLPLVITCLAGGGRYIQVLNYVLLLSLSFMQFYSSFAKEHSTTVLYVNRLAYQVIDDLIRYSSDECSHQVLLGFLEQLGQGFSEYYPVLSLRKLP